VDPYYLTFKAEAMGFHPQIILAGRRINDGMGKFIAEKTIKTMISAGCRIKGARVGLLGLTFKENVPDLRNSRVVDILHELDDYHVQALVHDPLADPAEALEEYGVTLQPLEDLHDLDALIVAVAHEDFRHMDAAFLRAMFRRPEVGIVMDVKGCLDRTELGDLIYWRL
jgi:UDP-N-acetyl-D-galactosamine dehydrogenase